MCAETRRDSIPSILTATEGSHRYGYEELAPDEQTWYDGIVEAVALFDANAGIDLYHTAPVDWNASIYTYESMQGLIKMLQRIYNDVPEMWHLYYIPRYENGTFVARIYKQNTPQNYLRNLQLLDSAYAEISKNVTDDMSLYDKILCLHPTSRGTTTAACRLPMPAMPKAHLSIAGLCAKDCRADGCIFASAPVSSACICRERYCKTAKPTIG